MRRIFLSVLMAASVCVASAQNGVRPEIALSIGDGSLYKPHSDRLGLSFDVNGRINYVHNVLVAGIGLGAALIRDARQTYFGQNAVTSELFLQVPVGIAARIKSGNTDIIIGGDVALMNASGRFYTEVVPHLDFLTRSKVGSYRGIFFKAMLNIGGDDYYYPSYYGVGYKVMLPPARKSKAKKPGTQAKSQ
jgi:hypothetical protein